MNQLYFKTRCLISLLAILLPMAAMAQKSEIKGKVSDDNGPIPGATILVKGTQTGASAMSDGLFRVNAAPNDTLLVSFLGYDTQEVPVGGRTEIAVILTRGAVVMDELVVIGYGVQRKSHLTGAITKFNPAGIVDIATSDITTALQGRMAGVSIQNLTSEVGAAPEIRVRGTGSISASSTPLIVVDGFVMEDGLQLINPADIQSIEILKDASSAAIYGSRAAGGVFLITTKEGVSNKPKYTVNYSAGLKYAYKLHPMMSYTDYVNILKREEEHGGARVPNNDLAAAWMESQVGATDWQKEALRGTAKTQNIQVSLSGGRPTMRYYLSGGFIKDEGLMKQNYNDKITFRSRVDTELSKYVTVGTNISFSYTETERPTNNFVDYARFPQWVPVYHNAFTSEFTGVAEGEFAHPRHFKNLQYPIIKNDLTEEWETVAADPYNSNNNNPAAVRKNTFNKSQTYVLSGNAYMNIKFHKNLVFRTANSIMLRYVPKSTYSNMNARLDGAENVGVFSAKFTNRWTTDNTVTWMNKYGKHDLNVMGGFSADSEKIHSTILTGTAFPTDYIKTLNAATAFKVLDDNGNMQTGTYEERITMASFMGRVNYSYDDKYLLSAVLRADGCSLFGKENRWAFFPSVSLGWRISEEDFMKDISQINSLKIRGSYGVTGNNKIENYANINTLATTLYPFGSGNGIPTTGLANTNSALGNPHLKWEQIYEYNAGFDLTAFKGILNVTFDAYYSTTKSMLFKKPIQSFTGYQEHWTNLGKVRNKGLELTVDTRNMNRGGFVWTTSVNFSMDRNKLIDLGNETELIHIGYNGEMYINRVGKPAIQFYGYKTQGVWLSQEQIDNNPSFATKDDRPGTLRVKNMNGDDVLDERDLTVIGNPYPDFEWGITNTFSYRGFDLSFLFQGVQGGQLINADAVYKDFQLRHEKYNIRNRFVSEEYPGDKKTPTRFGIDWIETDHVVEDATYVCLRNVTLGYTFDKKVTNKLHLSKLRVYVTGSNLLYFTPDGYRGINSEYRNTSSPYNSALISGYQRGAFPLASSITAGIDINF